MMESRRQSPPPSKVARFSDAGTHLTSVLVWPLVEGKSAFTFLQLQELEHQALIFQHMAAGVPVPSSSSSQSGRASPAPPLRLPSLAPSFMGCVGGGGGGGLCFDYGSSVDPEPGRCRRTDGKKWRCSKAVVPNHKYCERHMHRGRHRSRKPAEDGAAAASPAPTPPVAEVVATSAATLSISFPSEFHLAAAGTSISGGSISSQARILAHQRPPRRRS
ncbi:unnamed protein product [Spirodela intermedia]|uniref:Growth-regulating factor n=1 Tax=Spirodela intermedia TaxID=51605 RepID=A0A7I8IZH1_SPIIN|nr:unnamed protein product [Spirodela intermedia]CAA6663385.1 unnamed protein product [Spirodela intermedia]